MYCNIFIYILKIRCLGDLTITILIPVNMFILMSIHINYCRHPRFLMAF